MIDEVALAGTPPETGTVAPSVAKAVETGTVDPSVAKAHRRCGPIAKRAVDVILATTVLLVLSPLWAFVSIRIRRHDGGPVLYRQKRVGRGGGSFEMLKFRSMTTNSDDSPLRAIVERALNGESVAPANGSYKLHADPRVTPVGRWIRATSIDELPQLLNVLRGDMSLVGPRPALPWEVDLFPSEYRRRTDAVPGMTGLWQVSGRSRVHPLQMLEYDVQYVDNQSLWLDLHILFRTIPTLVRGDGAR
jgi:lipopolysaccharide/colanic/teichoic acid biosynthesis glycosyltransferase